MSTYVAQITTPADTYSMPFDNHQWVVEGGYAHSIQYWMMPQEIASAVMADIASLAAPANEITLTFGEEDDPTVVQRVIVLGVRPAGNPQKRYLLMTDVRWYFTRMIHIADVNTRRRTGDKRLIGNTLTDTTPVDTVAYEPWSLRESTPYTWDTFKQDTLTRLTTAAHGRPALNFVTDVFGEAMIPSQPVQALSTDSTGTMALARAIESVPGAGIYVALDGVIHVYEATLGAEKVIIDQLPKDLEDFGHLVLVDHVQQRGAKWHIYFDYEVEVRLTYNASGLGYGASPGAGAVTFEPSLDPILQVTDQELTIPLDTRWGGARTVGQGTWITLEEAFKAWGGQDWVTYALPTLTDNIVANHYFGDSLERYTVGKVIGSYDTSWGLRIQELMRCYRTLFRVNPNFWSFVRHAWAVRASIWDPTTSTRAPSPVYTNYQIMPYDRWASNEIAIMGTNILSSYPTTGLLVDGTPSGFKLVMVDEELGIFAIDRDVASKHPSASSIGISPVVRPASMNDALGLMEAQLQQLISATDSVDTAWKLATVISCAPASPNDLRRCYRLEVSMEEAKDTAGLSYTPTSHAPDQEARTHLTSARVAWTDDQPTVDAILDIFGKPTPIDPTFSIKAPQVPTTTLVPVNLEQELRPLAKAIAAADLMSKLDCYEGVRLVPYNKKLVPLGSITRIVHRVMKNALVTEIHCERPSIPRNAEDYLTGTSRNFLLQQIAKDR